MKGSMRGIARCAIFRESSSGKRIGQSPRLRLWDRQTARWTMLNQRPGQARMKPTTVKRPRRRTILEEL